MVGHGQCPGLFVNIDTDRHVAQLSLEVTERLECLQLPGGIDCVAHQLAEKYLMIAVKEFFDYGEYVFSSYPYLACSHIYDNFL